MAAAVGPPRGRCPTMWRQAAGLDARLLAMLRRPGSSIWLGFDVLTGGLFLTARNLFNLSLQVAVVGIMACRHGAGHRLPPHRPLGRLADRRSSASSARCCRPAGCRSTAPNTWWIACLAMLAAGAPDRARCRARWSPMPASPPSSSRWAASCSSATPPTRSTRARPSRRSMTTFQLLGGGINGTIGAFWSWAVGILAIAGDRHGGAARHAAGGAAIGFARADAADGCRP